MPACRHYWRFDGLLKTVWGVRQLSHGWFACRRWIRSWLWLAIEIAQIIGQWTKYMQCSLYEQVVAFGLAIFPMVSIRRWWSRHYGASRIDLILIEQLGVQVAESGGSFWGNKIIDFHFPYRSTLHPGWTLLSWSHGTITCSGFIFRSYEMGMWQGGAWIFRAL